MPDRMDATATAAAGAVLLVVLAAVDVAIGQSAVLIPLLVLGPLLASMRASARLTAAVAVIAVLTAIALGPIDQGLFAPQHIVQVIVVAGGSCFAVAAATARERFERAQRAA